MKKVLKIIWSIIEVFIIIYVIGVTFFVLCRDKYGYTHIGPYTFDAVNSFDEKNIENTKDGDLLVIKNSNDIYIKDRIYYYVSYNEAYVIRSDYVVDIQKDEHNTLYTVQRNGENIMISGQRVLGKYAKTYTGVGEFVDLLESSDGFLLMVLLPILVVFIYQIVEFIVLLKRDGKEKVKKQTISVVDDEIIVNKTDEKIIKEDIKEKNEVLKEQILEKRKKEEENKKDDDVEVL